MRGVEAAPAPLSVLRRTRHVADRVGDVALHGLTAAAAALAMLTIAGIIWKIFEGAWPAIQEFGLSFVWESAWNPVTEVFGAREFIVGTLVTSFGALLLAAPLSIAIGLFLSELSPPAIRGPIGTLIEMLAAVPSVVIGLWGIFVLGPFMRATWSRSSASTSAGCRSSRRAGSMAEHAGGGDRAEIMIVPIIFDLAGALHRACRATSRRDHWARRDPLGDGSGRDLPYVGGWGRRRGQLGMGRALGEAIAVTQVIGISLQPSPVALLLDR